MRIVISNSVKESIRVRIGVRTEAKDSDQKGVAIVIRVTADSIRITFTLPGTGLAPDVCSVIRDAAVRIWIDTKAPMWCGA